MDQKFKKEKYKKEKYKKENQYVITPGEMCSPRASLGSSFDKSVFSNVSSNPFSINPLENPIFWRVSLTNLKCFPWDLNRRQKAEKEGNTHTGYHRMKDVFGSNCPSQAQIKCKNMSILEWQNHKNRDAMVYGMYNRKDEDLPSSNIVFFAQVFELHETNEQLFICEIRVKRESFLALVPGESTIHLLDVCEVTWKYCMSCRIETEKRFMNFSDVVRETCAAICVTYPEFYCNFTIESFSLGVFRSDLLRLKSPIKLPLYVIDVFDEIYNRMILNDTEEFFVEQDSDHPFFTVTVTRRYIGEENKELEKIMFSTIYMYRHDNSSPLQWPKGTMINDATLLSVNLTQDILPIVFHHIQFYCSRSRDAVFKVHGTFSSYRGTRPICFTDTSEYSFTKKIPENWWEEQAILFHKAYEAAMKELIINNLPVIL